MNPLRFIRRRYKKLCSDIRYRAVTIALKDFAERDLDQWEDWAFDTKYGKVYVMISRKKLY